MVTLGSLPHSGVRNGALGVVVEAETHRVTVRLDDRREVAFDPAQYRSIAHGYAVTIHKAQGATLDRVYTLADPLMNRHAAYVALTRHREGVHLFADREAFPSRTTLDRALSRDGRKDLASDYSSAELRRAVYRYQELSASILHATREERPLHHALAAYDRLRDARQHVVEARRSLHDAVARVYADPARALSAIVRDPAALDTLWRGEVGLYSQLNWRRGLLATRAERSVSAAALTTLTGRLEAYGRSIAGLHAARARRANSQAGSRPKTAPDSSSAKGSGKASLRRLFPTTQTGPRRTKSSGKCTPPRRSFTAS